MATAVKALAALNDAVTHLLETMRVGVVAFQIVDSGGSTHTFTFEVTLDGANWVAALATNVGTGIDATTTTVAGIYRIDVSGLRGARVRLSTLGANAMNGVAQAVDG